jgi:hypothetical protein
VCAPRSISNDIPTTINTPCRLYEVLDKGKAASVTAIVHTIDKGTGQVIFENQTTLVVRGSGGFGGKRVGRGQLRHAWHEVGHDAER